MFLYPNYGRAHSGQTLIRCVNRCPPWTDHTCEVYIAGRPYVWGVHSGELLTKCVRYPQRTDSKYLIRVSSSPSLPCPCFCLFVLSLFACILWDRDLLCTPAGFKPQIPGNFFFLFSLFRERYQACWEHSMKVLVPTDLQENHGWWGHRIVLSKEWV